MLQVHSFSDLSNLHLFRIMEARSAVFVLEQKITRCAELDETDLHCIHIYLPENSGDGDPGCILAYARCYPEPDGSAHIGRVLTTVRGKGYGVLVMQEAIRVCREMLGASRITLSSQWQVCGFYKKLGFRIVGEPYDECGIKHFKMEL